MIKGKFIGWSSQYGLTFRAAGELFLHLSPTPVTLLKATCIVILLMIKEENKFNKKCCEPLKQIKGIMSR